MDKAKPFSSPASGAPRRRKGFSMSRQEQDQASLSPGASAHLGVQLRRLFNATADEPIPTRLTDLLDRLEQVERAAEPPPAPQLLQDADIAEGCR